MLRSACIVLIICLIQLISKCHCYNSMQNYRSSSYSIYDKFRECPISICEDPDEVEYPEEKILEKMNDKNNIRLFGLILNSTFENDFFSSRDSTYGTIDPICHRHKQTFKPLVMKNVEERWRYIVNVKNYQQTFYSEICLKDWTRVSKEIREKARDSHCQRIFNYECLQNFQQVMLLVYHHETGQIDFDRFKVPTTCSCCG